MAAKQKKEKYLSFSLIRTSTNGNKIQKKKKRTFVLPLKVEQDKSTISTLFCDICNYKTLDIVRLKVHMKSHAGEELFICNICYYKCGWHVNFKRHLMEHTTKCESCAGEKCTAGSSGDHSNSERTQHKCEICKFISSCTHDYEAHIKFHTGDMTYKCNQCEFTTALPGNLKAHLTIHADAGDKSMESDYYNYKAAYSSHMRPHLLNLTADKPFKCTECNYHTFLEVNMNAHMKTHIEEKPVLVKIERDSD